MDRMTYAKIKSKISFSVKLIWQALFRGNIPFHISSDAKTRKNEQFPKSRQNRNFSSSVSFHGDLASAANIRSTHKLNEHRA